MIELDGMQLDRETVENVCLFCFDSIDELVGLIMFDSYKLDKILPYVKFIEPVGVQQFYDFQSPSNIIYLRHFFKWILMNFSFILSTLLICKKYTLNEHLNVH